MGLLVAPVGASRQRDTAAAEALLLGLFTYRRYQQLGKEQPVGADRRFRCRPVLRETHRLRIAATHTGKGRALFNGPAWLALRRCGSVRVLEVRMALLVLWPGV